MKKSIYWSVAAVSLICASQPVIAAELTPKEELGKLMYTDVNFSKNSTQSCQTCHHPNAGFADPANADDPESTAVSMGAYGDLGDRNAPTSSYCGYSPILHYDTKRREYVGGMFWDGRATGEILHDPLAEQAQGPPLNPVEMAMESVEDVVEAVRNSDYSDLFIEVYGEGTLDDDNPDTDDAEWIIYDLIGDAIAAYERSSEVQQFSSRYDTEELSPAEQHGLTLFKNHCNRCHKIQHTLPHTSEKVDLFTSYSYANIGIPANPDIARDEPDMGLGYTIGSRKQRGKFKIPTLRNVALTAPYGHNGYFVSLEEIVSFKNNRNLYPDPPEVEENISPFIGDMGMTSAEVADLVSFLGALSDK